MAHQQAIYEQNCKLIVSYYKLCVEGISDVNCGS